jgi:hypothetical protein
MCAARVTVAINHSNVSACLEAGADRISIEVWAAKPLSLAGPCLLLQLFIN